MAWFKRDKKKKSRRQVWSLFVFWLGMVVMLLGIGLVVKGGWYVWYLWRWYDEPRVNVVSFDKKRTLVFTFDKTGKKVYVYVVPGNVKWGDQMGKEAKTLIEWQNDLGSGGVGLERLADVIEFNLAVPVKGLMWQKEGGSDCDLMSFKCLKAYYWPVGIRQGLEGSMSMGHRWFGWWLMGRYEYEVINLKFDTAKFNETKWDKIWQKDLKGERIETAVLGRIKSKYLMRWYKRMVENLGWRVVQLEWIGPKWIEGLSADINEDQNYCLWQGKKPDDYRLSRVGVFLRCQVSDKIKAVNARADLAIIINQFVW